MPSQGGLLEECPGNCSPVPPWHSSAWSHSSSCFQWEFAERAAASRHRRWQREGKESWRAASAWRRSWGGSGWAERRGRPRDVPAWQEVRKNCRSLVKQEGTQLSNYSTISSNSRLIVNCSSVPATSMERAAGGSSPAALLSLPWA